MKRTFRRLSPKHLVLVVAVAFAMACSHHAPYSQPSKLAVSQQTERRGVQFRVHGIEGLRVLEVVLGRVDFEDRLPVVLQLHGRGDRPRLPEGSYEHVQTPVRILIPQGPLPFGEGYSWAPVSVTEDRHAELAAALTEQADRLKAVLDAIRALRNVPGKPIVTGFSQGGMLAYTLAVRHPQSVGVALPIAGWLPPHLMPREDATLVRYAPIRALHGTADPIVRIEPTRRVVRRLRRLGIDASLDEFPGVEHRVSEAMRRRHRQLLEEALARIVESEGPAA